MRANRANWSFVFLLLWARLAVAADAPLLELVGKIPLGPVSGRIDHMSLDEQRGRLFVAELGNNTVGVVDLVNRRVIERLTNLSEPQGVIYVPGVDVLLVANGDDGSVRSFRGSDLKPNGRLELKRDADNLRFDAQTKHVWAGYGAGALAEIDPATLQKVAEIPLKGHPEAFQIAATGRIYVNVPDAEMIAVAERATHAAVAAWPMKARANFPMALADDGRTVAVAFRNPARLTLFAGDSGSVIGDQSLCGDADDVFFDAKRRRFYVSCGAGRVDVFRWSDGILSALAQVATTSGARTSYFDVNRDRLYVAARAGMLGGNAELWEFQPH